jgi:hypothetical protein
MLLGWQDIATTGRRIAEIASASGDVIGSRSATIIEAVASPATADHAELTRMVTEKVSAFSQSGSAMMRSGLEMQADYLRHAHYLSAMMLGGRPPQTSTLIELSSRSSTYALDALEAWARLGSEATKPIHRTVTANTRRLKVSGRRKSRS